MSIRTTCSLLVALVFGAGAAHADLSTGLLAYYPFSGDAADASGNSNHGTPTVSMVLTTDRFGSQNSAYEFNGLNSYILVPNSQSLSSPTTAMTQAAWVMLYGVSQVGSAFDPILMKSVTTENAMMYRLYCTTSVLGVAYGNWNNGLASDATLPLNEWHHVASTSDGAKIRQFVDGVQVDSTAFVYAIVPDTRPLLIGADTPGSFEVFNGRIDEVRIYDRALTGAEIGALADLTVGVGDRARPATLSFGATRPNPTRAMCSAEFSLPFESDVAISVFDVTGRLVRTLLRERSEAGIHTIAWEGRDLHGGDAPAGLYFMRLRAGDQERWSRVVRVR